MEEEFLPLFDYSHVQPAAFVDLDDEEELDFSVGKLKKKRKLDSLGAKKSGDDEVVILDDGKGGKEEDEEDWLPPPPPKVANFSSTYVEDDTLKALRLKKQELVSLAQSAQELLRSVTESTKKDFSDSEKSTPESKIEQLPKQVERKKIIISIQDKDGQKPFRMYKDDKFEKLFKMYADKVKLKMESLVFSFDGDKVSPTSTPEGLDMEDEDMIEVHIKS